MGLSKNAIVGKAHRLDLPPRPSPIRGAAEGRAKPAARVRSPVPPLASLLPSSPMVMAAVPVVARTLEPSPARPSPRQVSPRECGGCQWPVGKPGTAGFHLCGDRAAPGKPYWETHCGRAYVRLRDTASAAKAA